MVHHYFPALSPLSPTTSLHELILKSLRMFSRQRLQISLDVRRVIRGVKANNPEAIYQNEIYRTVFEASKGAVIPVPEFFLGYGTTQKGRIDFVLDGKHWGIEALIDNDDLLGHYQRFAAGGKYSQANFVDYVVLNFRKGIPNKTYCMLSMSFKLYLDLFAD